MKNRLRFLVVLFIEMLALLMCLTMLFNVSAYAAESSEIPPIEDDESILRQNMGARIVLSSYKIIEGDASDNTATLKIKLTNESQYVDAYSILISFHDRNNLFLPAYGRSNQIFIPRLAAGESAEREWLLESSDISAGDVAIIVFTVDSVDNVLGVSSNEFSIGYFAAPTTDILQLVSMGITGISGENGETPVLISVLNRTALAVSGVEIVIRPVLSNVSEQRYPLKRLEGGERAEVPIVLTLEAERVQQVYVSFVYSDESGLKYESARTIFTLYPFEDPSVEQSGDLLTELRPYISRFSIYLSGIAVTLGAIVIVSKRKAYR